MAEVIGRLRKGNIVLSIIKGEYKKKLTTSFIIKKRIKKDNGWQDSDFLTITDVQDIMALTHKVCNDWIKLDKVKPAPGQPA